MKRSVVGIKCPVLTVAQHFIDIRGLSSKSGAFRENHPFSPKMPKP